MHFPKLDWGWNVYAETYYPSAKVRHIRGPIFLHGSGSVAGQRGGRGREDWPNGQTRTQKEARSRQMTAICLAGNPRKKRGNLARSP